MNKDELIDYCKEASQTISKLDYKNRTLEKENQKLKKQLEQYKGSHYCSFIDICKSTKIANYNQQKEFIKYLEDEIKLQEEINDKLLATAFEEILQKYKSIIGVSDDSR